MQEANQNLEQVHGYSDYLVFQLSDCGTGIKVGGKKPKWQEIKFNMSGEPYCTHYGRRIYLNQILRAR
jgi:hypothetical protein